MSEQSSNHPTSEGSGWAAVIFDMDGVLIDSEPLHMKAKRETFQAFELDVPDAIYPDFYGRTDFDVIREVVDRFAPDLEFDAVLRAKQEAYTRLAEAELTLLPGILDLLRDLHGRAMRLALVTSASPANQALAFRRFDLGRFFEFALTAADVRRHKPDPEPYRTAVDRLGVAPHRTLVIEDAPNGIRSARGAGCAVAGLTTTFPAEELREAGAERVFVDIGSLRSWLIQPLPKPLGNTGRS